MGVFECGGIKNVKLISRKGAETQRKDNKLYLTLSHEATKEKLTKPKALICAICLHPALTSAQRECGVRNLWIKIF